MYLRDYCGRRNPRRWSRTARGHSLIIECPASLYGTSRALNGRSHAGVLHAGLAACNAWQPPLDSIRALKLPTLVIGGRRDLMTPLKAGKALAAEIPGARFVELDAGHSMMSECPRAVLDHLRGFLRPQ